LVSASDVELQNIRGNEISMIFQDPASYLNPLMKVGHQIREAVLLHEDVNRQVAKERAIEVLNLVRIPDPERHSCR